MSTDELVNAYIEGSVSRRTFIRRLVALGVSVGAAVSYAHLLTPQRAGAAVPNQQPNPDFYHPPHPTVGVGSKSIDAVVNKGRVTVYVSVDEPATVLVTATATIGGKPKTISSATVDFGAAGTQLVTLRIRRKLRNALGDLEKTIVQVTATATDRQGQSGSALASKRLKNKGNH
jgi:hypothetical protein